VTTSDVPTPTGIDTGGDQLKRWWADA